MPRARANLDQVLQTGRIAYGDDGTNQRPIKVDASGNIGVSNTETIQTELLIPQSLAASTWVTSTVLSLAGVKTATFFFDYGKADTVAVAGTGTEFRVEVSQQASGNDTWRAKTTWYAATTAAASCAASAGAAAAGTSVINTVAGTAMGVSNIVCFTSGTIEWTRVVSVGGTAQFTIQDPLTYNHVAATGIFSGGDHTGIGLDVSAVTRCRVAVNNNYPTTSRPCFVRAACITGK